MQSIVMTFSRGLVPCMRHSVAAVCGLCSSRKLPAMRQAQQQCIVCV
jgi:hypothetical protein